MAREPLYQRIEHLARSRKGFAVAYVVLLAAFVFAPLLELIGGQKVATPAFTFGVNLVAVAIIALGYWASRRAGRRLRTERAVILPRRSGRRVLDVALDSYEVRTGETAPLAAVVTSATPDQRIDAELMFCTPSAGQSGLHKLRSVLDAKTDDVPLIAFTQAMLDAFDSSQILAVLVHLVARADLLREGRGRFDNCAVEADSRTLLITHDHISLLRALEGCTHRVRVLAPTFGHVNFADADMRITVGDGERPEQVWVSRDRLTELRNHLGAAGLDVPRTSEPWLPVRTAQSVMSSDHRVGTLLLWASALPLAMPAVLLAVLWFSTSGNPDAVLASPMLQEGAWFFGGLAVLLAACGLYLRTRTPRSARIESMARRAS